MIRNITRRQHRKTQNTENTEDTHHTHADKDGTQSEDVGKKRNKSNKEDKITLRRRRG